MATKTPGGVEVEFEGHGGDDLSMTLRGPAKLVVGVLVSGMSNRALEKLSVEIDKVTATRTARKKKGGQ